MKKKGFKKFFDGGPKGVLIGAIIVFGCMLTLHHLTSIKQGIKLINYSAFMKHVEAGNVKKMIVSGNDVAGELRDGTTFETVVPSYNPENWSVYTKNNIEVEIDSSAGQMNIWYLLPVISLLFTFLFIWYFFRQARNSGGGGSGGNIFSMGKSKARMSLPSTIKENFDSVAGAHAAKEELRDLVNFLKDPEKFQKIGAKITRGVLLIGEPGNGKTLLARAVAGEANCPFFSISGSDFIEVFVGVGASRVRDLFAQAKAHSPSIIFIDEIDAIGRHRGSGLGGGHDEREQTLNQLLTEMDGFQTTPGAVIVLAATNRPDVLDKALLRPGRFDRRVVVPYPDLKSRLEILNLHGKAVKMSPDVDLSKLARGTPGFTGADLANLINEAALHASKFERTEVTVADIEEARDKHILGKENKTMIQTKEDLEKTAYHEAGHALVGLLLPEHTDPVYKMTILPRGRALGVTHFLPEREKYSRTRKEIEADIAVCMGGRAAEKLMFDILSSGAGSDFMDATKQAREMICHYGMSDELGLAIYDQGHEAFKYSQKTAERIDMAVQKVLDEQYQRAVELITTNKDKLDLLAKTLLEKETMEAEEMYALLGISPREFHKIV
ncbi:MAG TPA: ATP-dependent zinc metalloprotease FtsH [Candidatus Babeliales bacterium]|nr:ATP-dependent zinc metalloprotease FtsH [Candidatus Babeliales bacterium]